MFEKKRKFVTNCILIVTLLGSPLMVYANTPVDSRNWLTVKPKICVTVSADSACQTTVVAEWSYFEAISACLYIKGVSSATACWQHKTSGQTEFQINTPHTIELQLQHSETLHTLLSTQIQILSRSLKVKQLRRKKRHAWSLF